MSLLVPRHTELGVRQPDDASNSAFDNIDKVIEVEQAVRPARMRTRRSWRSTTNDIVVVV